MTRQKKRFLIIVAIQLVILGVIVFFPEQTKQRLFSSWSRVSRPDVSMSLQNNDVDDVVRAIDDAGLFERYRWTRAVGVETPVHALMVLPDGNFGQFWHFEQFLVSSHDAGIGALILDLRDVAAFVPLRAKDGSLRTTGERMRVFTDASRRWLLALGFSEVTLVSFGTGSRSALDTIEASSPGDYAGWIDVAGSASAERWMLASENPAEWPPTLMVCGAFERDLQDKIQFVNDLRKKGFAATYQVIPEAGPILLDKTGKLDRYLEEQIVQRIFAWTKHQE